MKILITGGAGFIGKHLVKNILKNNFQVTIFDNFSNSDRESILDLIKMGAKIIDGDITNIQEISDAVKNHEVIVHLAALISVEESIKNPSKTFHINIDGTKNVLEACKKNNIKKIVVASSSAVYGECELDFKLSEETKLKPISPYGKSKAKMEQEIIKFVSEYKMNYVILRFFNIFGLGQSSEYAGVITKFIDRIKKNESLEIFGNGMQTRDFISILDVVNAINNTISSKSNGIYNIGSGKIITIKELAEKMILWSGKKLEIKFLPSKKGDIMFSQADIHLSKKELKYVPKFGLEEIKNML
jgi:UDP-glucose 4-epimerase